MKPRRLARDTSNIDFEEEPTPKKVRNDVDADVETTPIRLKPFPNSPLAEIEEDSLPCFEEADMNRCCKRLIVGLRRQTIHLYKRDCLFYDDNCVFAFFITELWGLALGFRRMLKVDFHNCSRFGTHLFYDIAT